MTIISKIVKWEGNYIIGYIVIIRNMAVNSIFKNS